MSAPAYFVGDVQVLGPPPPGVTPNIENPEVNWATQSYCIVAVGNFLVALLLCQRLYVRFGLMKLFELEDAILIAAVAFSTTEQAMILSAFVNKFLGIHYWELPVTQMAVFQYRAAYLFAIIYIPAQMCSKLVLSLFYRKLSPQPWFNYMVWATTFCIVSAYISILLASIFTCSPIAKAWQPSLDGKCIDAGSLYKATAVIGIILDLFLILLPIPVVAKLQIPTRQKFGLLLVFSVGSATVVTSFKRYFILIDQVANPADFVWNAAESSGWVLIETNLSIMCACVPTLRGFFRAVAPRLIGVRSSDRKSKKSGGPGSAGGTGGQSSRTAGGSRGADPTLATFGGSGAAPRGPRNQYGTYADMDDEDDAGAYDMGTIARPRDEEAGIRRGDTDNDSEKGIIQTQSVTVTYSTPEGEASSR